MTPAGALALAEAGGLILTADGDRLRWRGPSPSRGLLDELRRHKADILHLLTLRAALAAPSLSPPSPEQAQAEREDREAIGAELLLAAPGTPEREQGERAHRAMVAGLVAASRREHAQR